MWQLSGFAIGIVLGSFAKALADRSLNNRSFGGRSYCLNCKHKLQWYDLLPVLSYIFLVGKCRYCHKKVEIEYLLVEVGVGVLIGFLFFQSFNNLQFTIYNLQSIFNYQNLNFLITLILKTFFIVILITLFLTDLKKMFIPDRVILPAILIGLSLIIINTLLKIIYLYSDLSQSQIGRLLLPPHSPYFQRHALLIAQPLFISLGMGLLIGGFFMSLIIITRGKGMGGGDVKLGAFMGLMLGFPGSLIAIIGAFLTGAIFSIGLLIQGKKHFGESIPFGPFLVLGSLIALFWGNQIMNWYLHLSI